MELDVHCDCSEDGQSQHQCAVCAMVYWYLHGLPQSLNNLQQGIGFCIKMKSRAKVLQTTEHHVWQLAVCRHVPKRFNETCSAVKHEVLCPAG